MYRASGKNDAEVARTPSASANATIHSLEAGSSNLGARYFAELCMYYIANVSRAS